MSTFAASSTFNSKSRLKRSNTNQDLSNIINQMDKDDVEDSLLGGQSRDSHSPDLSPEQLTERRQPSKEAIDITKSFYFGENSPKRKNFQLKDDFLDNQSMEEFNFPPKPKNNRVMDLQK